MFHQLQAFSLVKDDPFHRVILDVESFAQAIQWLEQQPLVAVDTETSGLAWYQRARMCGISMGAWDRQAGRSMNFYFPFRHQTNEKQLPVDVVLEGVKRVLHNTRIEKVFHNIKFDEHMLARDNIRVLGPRRDTQIEAALYDENQPLALKDRTAIDLQDNRAHVFENLLDARLEAQAKESGVGKTVYRDRFGYARIPVQMCGVYAAHDTDFTLALANFYDSNNVRGFFQGIYSTEMELTKVLFQMEENGLPIHADYLKWLAASTSHAMENLRGQMVHQLGEFNPDSDEEVVQLITKHLRLEHLLWKRTDSGTAWSVDVEVLTQLSDEAPILKTLLDYREAAKIRSTYTTSILDRLDANGVLHGDFQQVGTKTGRLSAKSPNLQNFASDSDERALAATGKKVEDGGQDPWSVKRAFINRGPEFIRGYFDYSQIELRVLAKYSNDPTLIDVYKKNDDVHTRTSQEVYGVTDKSARRKAKIIAFGLSYGMSAKGFARQAKIPLEEAEAGMERFFQRYPRISPFRDEFWALVRSQGGVFTNMFGRARRMPKMIGFQNNYEKGSAERRVFGSLIQGTAAELTKESLVRIAKWEEKNRSGLLLVSTIHDEISMDIPHRFVREVLGGVVPLMESYPQFDPVPIMTGAEYSDTNWSEPKKFPKGMVPHVHKFSA